MSNKINRTCLVLMPFEPKYKEIYDLVYKSICTEISIDCYRIDEISKPGSITRDIVSGIIDADIIIADLTSKNSNVFYELGIAHSVGNKTIMTCQNGEVLPFDIANYRVIFYEQSLLGAKELSETLKKSIKELLVSLNQNNNPVQDVLLGRNSLGLKQKIPLLKFLDSLDLTPKLWEIFKEESIYSDEDVKKIDLNSLKAKYNLGKTSWEKLIRLILENDLYDNYPDIHEFILNNKISTYMISRKFEKVY